MRALGRASLLHVVVTTILMAPALGYGQGAQAPAGAPAQGSAPEEKKLFIKQADVYGAYLAYADHEIGRVIQAVEDLGELDNTLIIYIGGDNGASAEGDAQPHAERVHHLQWRVRAGQGPVSLVRVLGLFSALAGSFRSGDLTRLAL